MTDRSKSKQELIQELASLRQRIAELEQSELGHKRAEKTLHEAERLQRLIFEHSSDVIYILDCDLRVTSVSTSVERHLGYRTKELVGRHFNDLNVLAPESLEAAFKDALQALAGDIVPATEYVFIRKDGTRVIGEVSGSPLVEDGKIVGLISVARDITERKRAEEDLSEKSQFIASLMRAMPVAVFYKDKEGRYLGCNDTFTNIMGVTSEQIKGKTVHELWPSELAEKYHHMDLELIRNRGHQVYEFQVKAKDGQMHPVIYAKDVFLDKDGEVAGLVGAFLDISDRKRVESIMQARLRLLEFAISHSMDEFLTATLDEIEALTGSTIGFYHFLESDQKTLSLKNWSTNTLKNMCTAEGKGGHYDIAKAGVWVDCVHERRSVIHNDYVSLPHRKGMPEGHAPVVRVVVVPIFRGNLIKAIIGVGNKSTNYDESDIEIVSQLGDLSWDITERKRTEEELSRVNRALQLLSNTNQALMHITDEATLLNEVCRIAVDVGGYRLVWVGFVEHDEAKTLRPVAHAGFDSGYIESAKVTWADNERGLGPGGTAIRTGQPCMVRNIPENPSFAPWREEATRRGYKSIIALPLTIEGQTFGAMGIYSVEADVFNVKEVKILKELADDLAFGITALRTRAKRDLAEEALHESEEKYRKVADFTYDWEYWLAPDGKYIYVSPACERISGYQAEEYQKDPELLEKITHPDDKQRLAVHFHDVLRGKSDACELEYRIITRDGKERWISHACQEVFSHTNEYLGRRGSNRDITDRKRAEETLRHSEQEKTIRNQIANVFLTIPDEEMYGEILNIVLRLMNSSFGIFGYIGGNGDLVIPSLTRDIWRECQVPDKAIVFPSDSWGESLWGRAIKEKKSFSSDGPFRTPEGHVHVDHFLAAPMVFGQKTIGLISVANKEGGYTHEDMILLERITGYISPILAARLQRDRQELKRRQAEASLQESEERYRTAIEACNDGVAIVEEDLPIFVNQRYVEILGYERPEEVLGKPISNLIHPEDRERVARINRLRQGGTLTPSRYEFKALRKDGKDVHIEISATRTFYKGRAVSLTFHRDVTQRKQLEAQLQQAQKMEALGTLAGGVAHDFNNILAVIVGCTDLLLLIHREDLKSERHLIQILDAANRATNLVQQILTFSRQRTVDKKPLQLSLIVKEVLKMLRSSLPSTIQIKQYVSPDSGMALADPTQIHQILMNLCTNAAYAMREQGGLLDVSLSNLDIPSGNGDNYPDLSPGAYLRLTVSDTGHGMKREVLERIFDPYFTTKNPGEGTGLGLAVVHGIIQDYKGSIRVHSEPGQGTTFQILLPRMDHPSVLEDTGPIPEDLPLGHERILFVDDEAVIVNISELMLKHLGYEVVAITSSIDALRLFRDQPDRFDLVITDMTMPYMTGDTLAIEIMKIRPDIPVILCTGFSERITKDKAKALGIREFVLKPLMMQDLAKKVREALDKKEVKIND
jgi:PAS domain S-box-containing protein